MARVEFIKIWKRSAILYVPKNSYAYNFFLNRGFSPYSDFTINPLSMTIDENGTPRDVLNVVEDDIVIVNENGDFTLTLKAVTPQGVNYNSVDWSFSKVVAGELIDCDDTEVSFKPDEDDVSKVVFSISTIQDEACPIVISGKLKGGKKIIGNSPPIEVRFYDIPKIVIEPKSLMFDSEDILDYDTDTQIISVEDKLGVFELNVTADILEGVDYDNLDWSYEKNIVGDLSDCSDTAVVITPDQLDPLKALVQITTIDEEACSVVVKGTIMKNQEPIEESNTITVEFIKTEEDNGNGGGIEE